LRDLKRNYLSQQNMGGAMAHVKLPLTSSYPRKLAKRNLKRCMTVLGYFICILTKFRILDLPPSYTRLIHVGYLRFKGPTPSIAEPPEMGHHNPRARNRCQQVPPQDDRTLRSSNRDAAQGQFYRVLILRGQKINEKQIEHQEIDHRSG
jgi:hypothetical protein